MYKSTEIFIPVKVDAQLHLCPLLPAPTWPLLLADCPAPPSRRHSSCGLWAWPRDGGRDRTQSTRCVYTGTQAYGGVFHAAPRPSPWRPSPSLPCLVCPARGAVPVGRLHSDRNGKKPSLAPSDIRRGVNSATVVPPSITPVSEAPPTGSSD